MAKTTSKAAAKASSRSIPAHYQRLEGSERHPPAAAKHLGLADPDEVLQVSIVLRRRPDGPAVPDFDHFANTHPSRRPRLSQEEFAARHGAAPADLAAVGGFARAQGLSVVESHAARRTVVVSGTTAQMSRAFAVKLGRYRHQGGGQSGTETWRGLDGHIHLPKELAGMVIGVFGLDNRGICKRAINEDPPVTAQLQVQTAAQCYNFPSNQATGQNIAILTPSGYYPPDLQQYFGGTPPVVDVFTGTIDALPQTGIHAIVYA